MFGFMEHSTDHGDWIQALNVLFPAVALSGVMPSYVRSTFNAFAVVSSASRKAAESFGKIILAAKDCVAERQRQIEEGKPLRQDILTKLFDIHRQKGDKEDFHIPEIEQEAWAAV
jgi:hypothetical protein